MPNPTIKCLSKSPLIEALFEIRFSPIDINVAEMFSGLMYSALRSDFPSVTPLQLANAPIEFREAHEILKYQATHRIFSPTQSLQIGPRVLAISIQKYESWANFKALILKVLTAANHLNVISRIERYSFKYINVIPEPDNKSVLSDFNIELQCCSRPVANKGLQIRYEENNDGYVNVVQLAAGANAKNFAGEKSGTLLNIDTIRELEDSSFFSATDEILERGHTEAKRVFFDLLKYDAVQQFQPVYQE